MGRASGPLKNLPHQSPNSLVDPAQCGLTAENGGRVKKTKCVKQY